MTPALRLLQMRSLVREFSASTIRATVERPLQFRPQPVFRFENPTAERDGAIFVGFEEFDPEGKSASLLIETRQLRSRRSGGILPGRSRPRWCRSTSRAFPGRSSLEYSAIAFCTLPYCGVRGPAPSRSAARRAYSGFPNWTSI
jgi:hypothetical protein